MAFVTGDVVPNPDGDQPFKVVFKQGDDVIAEWEVESKSGEEEIVEFIQQGMDDEEDEDEEEK